MKKFLLSAFTFLSMLYVIDRAGAWVMMKAWRNSRDVWSYKINYIANKADQDVVLLGTSRCHNHYVSSIISDTLGMTVYNAGITSTRNIYSHYIVLSLLLNRHTPKVVCLELAKDDFTEADGSFGPVSFFTPYLGESQCADSVFMDAGIYWQLRLSHLYRFNGRGLQSLAGLLLDWQQDDDNGYIPTPKPTVFPSALEHEEPSLHPDKNKLDYLQRFILQCRSRGIRLVFMTAPMFSVVGAGYYEIPRRMDGKYGIPFLDHHTQGMYHDHPEYFYDKYHLWDKSARMYSSHFASELKTVLEHLSNKQPNREGQID